MNARDHLERAEDYAADAALYSGTGTDDVGLTDGSWRTVEHFRAMADLHVRLAVARLEIPEDES